MFNMYDEPEWLHEAVCLRYMMNWNRQIGGRVYDI